MYRAYNALVSESIISWLHEKLLIHPPFRLVGLACFTLSLMSLLEHQQIALSPGTLLSLWELKGMPDLLAFSYPGPALGGFQTPFAYALGAVLYKAMFGLVEQNVLQWLYSHYSMVNTS